VLTIYLHRSQEALLEELRGMFPDLEAAAHSAYPCYTTYHAYLSEEDQGRRQKGWLTAHYVLFVDTERVRERRARVFVRHASLAPEEDAPLALSFARVENDPDFHRMTISSRQHQATLYLSAAWTGREHTPFHLWLGAIYVVQEKEALVVYCFDAAGRMDHEIYRLPTVEEMTRWLLERRYLQIYALTPTPGVEGLYLRLHEDGLPEMLRVDT
jgi:hypothetical protein